MKEDRNSGGSIQRSWVDRLSQALLREQRVRALREVVGEGRGAQEEDRGDEKRENPGRQRQREMTLPALHHHIIRIRRASCSRLGRKIMG